MDARVASIEYRVTGGPWVRWPDSAHYFQGRAMTLAELRRIVEHHNTIYPDHEYRLVNG